MFDFKIKLNTDWARLHNVPLLTFPSEYGTGITKTHMPLHRDITNYMFYWIDLWTWLTAFDVQIFLVNILSEPHYKTSNPQTTAWYIVSWVHNVACAELSIVYW